MHQPRTRTKTNVAAAIAGLVVASIVAGGCGGDSGGSGDSDGAAIAADAGCVACHGDEGQGGAGPKWEGLAGSTVELEDGTEVVADTEYIRRSIVDPSAEIVSGYSMRMPDNDLSDDEVDALVTYIESLGR